MYSQVPTQSEAHLSNGSIIHPVATLKSEYGGVAHIWIDDHCYQLGLESSAEAKSDGTLMTGPYVIPTTHIFPEAFIVLKGLPDLVPA